jgi:hypothetical protein
MEAIMADPKSPAKPDEAKTKTDDAVAEQAKLFETHANAVSSGQNRLVAIGRLRRDTMILGHDEDVDVINQLASSAVREGRAAEVFVFEAIGYFSESEVDFVPAPVESRALRNDSGDLRPPLLNPSTGEQAEGAGDTAIQANIPTHGATGGDDGNKGAGTGTGNEAKTADAPKGDDKK